VKINEIDNYIEALLSKDTVQELLEENKTSIQKPVVRIVPSCGPRWAALTYSDKLIEISSWIIVDPIATLSVARHEFAHILANGCKLPGTSHGRSYTYALKHVAKRTWRKDKYWYPSPKIEEARLKIHTTAKSLLKVRE